MASKYILLLIGVAFTWYTIGRLRDLNAVRRLEAEVRKKGEPLTLKELASSYPPIPDDENTAIPLLDLWEKEDPVFWNQFREGRRPLPEKSERRYDPGLPYLGDRKFRVGQKLAPVSREAAKSFLEERAAHLDAVRLALKRPRCRFPINIDDGLNALLPHLSAIKTEAATLRIAALIEADGGDVKQALSCLREIIAVGDMLAGEPTSISQLVRVGCHQIAITGAEDLLSRRALSKEELSQLREVLESIEGRKTITRSLVGERAMILSIFNLSNASLAEVARSESEENPNDYAANYRFGMKILSAVGLTVGDRRLMLETMKQTIELAEDDSPDAYRRAKRMTDALDQKLQGFPPKIIARLMLPAVDKIVARFVTLEARKRSALAALAVEIYRLEHEGILPEQLLELRPQFPEKMPIDPFDGESLRYRRLPTGYVVYSVGPDLHDDGGDKLTAPRSAKYLDETFRVLRN